ncbi:Deoxynucleoside kinase [uncultured virus]|nr:Deoxynucleoside kinase [uncultured virus]
MEPSIVMVEGIIGAGKTTFCHLFHTLLTSKGIDSIILYEPITDDDPTLKLFLSNCERYAFFFQISIVQRRIKLYKKALKLKAQGKVVIIDRSLRGDQAFEEMFYRKGTITQVEHEYYLAHVNDVLKSIIEPDMIVYLDVSTTEAMTRIASRNRMTETSVYDENYLTTLKSIYDEVICRGDNVISIKNSASADLANYKTNMVSALKIVEGRLAGLIFAD